MQMLCERFLEQINVEIPLILGGTPFGGVLLLAMLRFHAQMFFFQKLDSSSTQHKNHLFLIQQSGHSIDTSIETALVKMCASFEKSNDFLTAHRALLQLTQGCKDVAMCMKSTFDQREYSSATGFHSFLRSADILLIPTHARGSCQRVHLSDFQRNHGSLSKTRYDVSHVNKSARAKNSLLNLIKSDDDLRTSVLWNEQANVIKCFHMKSRVRNDMSSIMTAANIP